jgi:hypothetical protein
LRDVKLLGRFAERAATGHRREVTQADARHFPNSPRPKTDADRASCRR